MFVFYHLEDAANGNVTCYIFNELVIDELLNVADDGYELDVKQGAEIPSNIVALKQQHPGQSFLFLASEGSMSLVGRLKNVDFSDGKLYCLGDGVAPVTEELSAEIKALLTHTATQDSEGSGSTWTAGAASSQDSTAGAKLSRSSTRTTATWSPQPMLTKQATLVGGSARAVGQSPKVIAQEDVKAKEKDDAPAAAAGAPKLGAAAPE
jgi:hypothetical protein